MNQVQKEIVVLACRELCASRGEPSCAEATEGNWTPCLVCGRIAAIATSQHSKLAITVQHAIEELESQIDGGEECRGRDSEISGVIRILRGEAA